MTNWADRQPEVATKVAALRAAMAQHEIDVAALTLTPDVAWLAAGASTYVNIASESSVATLVITADRAYVVTDTIEAPRLEHEEGLLAVGFELVVEPWYAHGVELDRLLAGQRAWTSADGGDLGEDLLRLRTQLLPAEIDRLRVISREATDAVEEAALAVQPGMNEYAIAGLLDRASRDRGGQAIVNLVATDERISRFRHPLPADKTLERYAMVVVCYRREGLIVSATRLVHFGPLPEELKHKAQTTAEIDGQIILGTVPGRTLGDGFALLKAAYAAAGFPEAIEQHHQGGVAGYRTREQIATPANPFVIAPNQMYAWNPSIRGVKSEDSVLVTDHGVEVLTTSGNWPTTTITVAGQSIARPIIWVR